ncbi:MAG: cytochrome c [Caldilineaceae bacterium]
MKKNKILTALLLFLFVLSACGSRPEDQAADAAEAVAPAVAIPTLAPTVAAAVAAMQPAPSATLNREYTSNADAINNTSDGGLPAAIAALLPTADPAHGSELTVQKGCTACHARQEGVKLVGPSWYNLGNVAAKRVAKESPALYLYHSVVDPNQYVVEGYLPSLMIQTYREQLSDQELADLIAYLLTLKAE